jgi:putative membrane protein
MTDVAAPPQATSPHEAAPTEPSVNGTSSGHQTERTRISAAWVGVIAGALVLILLLVFILQNTRTVRVSYFTATGSMPLGIALLLAAIAGLLLAGGIAALRIWQLRYRLTRQEESARLAPVLDRSVLEGDD